MKGLRVCSASELSFPPNSFFFFFQTTSLRTHWNLIDCNNWKDHYFSNLCHFVDWDWGPEMGSYLPIITPLVSIRTWSEGQPEPFPFTTVTESIARLETMAWAWTERSRLWQPSFSFGYSNTAGITPEVVTKLFRTHLARLFWRNTVKAGRGGQRKTEMGNWRMAQKLQVWLWFWVFFSYCIWLLWKKVNRNASVCLFFSPNLLLKLWWKKVYHMWLGTLSMPSRLHKSQHWNQAVISTMLSTARPLVTSPFCKCICFHIFYAWHTPSHFIHMCIYIFFWMYNHSFIPSICIYRSTLGTENSTMSKSQRNIYSAVFPLWRILKVFHC